MSAEAQVSRQSMKSMRLHANRHELVLEDRPVIAPRNHEVLIQVAACGVCRTDLHVVDGELPEIPYPVTPGHEIVGRVVARGSAVRDVREGMRVGVPWLGFACGTCADCLRGKENLCANAKFTGYTIDGGYAQYVLADSRFCLRLPENYTDVEAAPLLCAGLIGYRAYRAAGDAATLGLYGFGAAAHLLTQLALAEGREVYAFTRPGDRAGQQFARSIGAVWSGDSTTVPPRLLDAAILFAPDGTLVPAALRAIRKGGRVVCAGIHMSDIPSFPYDLLWGERTITSVANLTRRDGEEFLLRASQIRLHPSIEQFPLESANDALRKLRDGALTGCAVLKMS